MQIEIDQSGRIEYTSHPTLIADSSGHSVYVTKRTKRAIQVAYRRAGRPKVYVYELFAFLITLVIQKTCSKSHMYVIDTEYPGKSDIIKQLILKFASKFNLSVSPAQITFGKIEEGSSSDALAHYEFLKVTKARKINYEEIMSVLNPTKKDRV